MAKNLRSLGLSGLMLATVAATGFRAYGAEELPYDITFSSSNYNTWTIVDVNGDGDNFGAKCWAWQSNNSYLRFNLLSSQNGAADDWVISPAFDLEEGTQYEITYLFYGDSGSAKAIPVDLKLVTSLTAPESDGMVLASYPPEFTSTLELPTKNSESYTATFTAPATGTYYIGAHTTAEYVPYTSGGPAEQSGRLVFRNFGIKALQKATAPGELDSFTVTPGADGEVKATFSFTAPSTDAEGNELKGTVKVNIYREDEETPFFTSEDMTAGQTGTAEDTDPFDGETWYVARALNGSGEGPALTREVYIGEDVPLAPANVVLALNDEGKIVVSWDAPEGGVHGQYVNIEGLKYQLSRVVDGNLASLGMVEGTEFVDSELGDDTQVNVSYQVVGRSSAGLGAAVKSRTINYGKTLSMPFAESFANKSFTTNPWNQEVVFNFEDANYQPEWGPIEQAVTSDNVTDDNPEGDEIIIASQDTDKGFIRFNSSQVGKMKDPAKGRLISPSIDMSEMLNPVLTFWMFHDTYYTTNPATNGGYRDDYIIVEAASDNGEFAPIEGAEFHRYGKDNDWVQCEVPLYMMAGKDRVQFAFLGHGFGGGPIYIDNIKIEERTAYDLEATSFVAPKRVRIGETGVFTALVKNNGGFEAANWKVELLKDGESVASQDGTALNPGRYASVAIEYSPEMINEGEEAEFTAKVVYAEDQETDNNISEPVTTLLAAPLLPAATDLVASNENGVVTINWKKASHLPAETLVEEDGFEGYEPFVIDSFGEFSTYDLDNRLTFGLGQAAGVTYPNSGEKMAYQIFAPSLVNIDDEEQNLWAPHSGIKMAIAPQAFLASSETGATASNDWLIFPQLSGNAQTITLWVRSVSDDYKESIQGFYTTTSRPEDADDFIPCPDGGGTSYEVPAKWTMKSYNVPVNAKYFALRHVSVEGYILMVDDVTYERSIPDAEEAGLLGYNIYVNDEKLNEDLIPVGTHTYSHIPAEEGAYNYHVKAVYPVGESAKSNEHVISFIQSAISTLTSDLSIRIEGMKVMIKGEGNFTAQLYTTSGLLADSIEGAGELTAPGAGVYLLNLNGRITKIVIK